MKKLVATIVLVCVSSTALAHDIYGNLRDRDGHLCCGGQDCKPVQAIVLPNGNYYLPESDETIPANMASPSPDERFHHCTYYPVANEFDPWGGPVWGSSPGVAGYSDLGLILCRFWIEAQRGLVFVIELFSHRSHLSTFELGDFDSTPTLGSADERAEHQLQNSSLTKGVGNDLEAAALLDEQALKQIRRADRPAMGHRELKVCDTGLEVVHETCDAAFLLPAVIGDNAGRELARDRAARRLVGRLYTCLELRPHILRHLGCQIAHTMRQAALAGSARKAHLDRLDDAWRPVRGHQKRIREPAHLHVFKKRRHRLGVFLGTSH